MSKVYRIIIAPRVVVELETIHRYIAKDSSEAADRVVCQLLNAFDSLNQFPKRHAVYRGRRMLSERVRRMLAPPYLIYYRVDDQKEALKSSPSDMGVAVSLDRFVEAIAVGEANTCSFSPVLETIAYQSTTQLGLDQAISSFSWMTRT